MFDENDRNTVLSLKNRSWKYQNASLKNRVFPLEVLSLYIPDLVEGNELKRIAGDLSEVDSTIPFTILALLPEHQMKDFRKPNTKEMVEAYRKVKGAGLERVRLGNLNVFVQNNEDWEYLMANIDMSAL